MQKFFVNEEQIKDNVIIVTGEDVNHISNVLRLRIGEEVIVGNKKSGESYLCKIKQINQKEVILDIIKLKEESTEPNTYIHILQGLPKADKMEQIIQKCTEIGVSEFTPVAMERSIVKLEGKDATKKIERWQKIAETAAKQSKRDIIPKINTSMNFKNIFENLKNYDIVLVAYENEKEHELKQVLKEINRNNFKKIAIIIGPEGGISTDEIKIIEQYGGKSISLGKRILRTETASVVVSSIILYEFESG